MKPFTHSLDQAVLDEKTYHEVIEKLYVKFGLQKNGTQKAPLIKGLSIAWIVDNKPEFMKLLTATIQKDDFEFSIMKLIHLKTEEKTRKIYLSNLADRITLMAIQNTLSEELNKSFHPHLFSFRKGYGPKKAALALSGYLKSSAQISETIFFLGRDISSYGDNIDHRTMDNILESTPALAGSSLLLPLLKKTYACEYYEGSDSSITVCPTKGIPSGSPIVPVLENLYLTSLDKELGSLKGSFYARYGDDFIFLTPNESQAKEAAEKIKHIVSELKLSISEKKEKNYFLGKKAHYTGFENKEFFEWIGITFYKDGTYSFRPKHKKQYKKKIRTEIGNFTHHLAKSGIEQTHISDCINSGFNELNNISLIPEVQKLIVLRTHIQNSKGVDKASREFLIRCLCKTLKVNRKTAWKFFRKMSLHSLEYQRRKLKCNKAA
jgi:retron-type reverse transcriptase